MSLTRGKDGLDNACPASIAELEALIGVAGSTVQLTGSRAGTFEWTVGDYSAEVAADILQGVYVKATAVAATVGCWVRQGISTLDPKWFGAVGNGSTDDAASLQACFNFCGLNGIPVVLSVGTYALSEGLHVDYDNTHISGVSRDLVILRSNNNATSQAGIVQLLTAGTSGVTLKDFTIDGNSVNNLASVASGVYGTNTSYCTIENLRIKNTPKNGIHLAASTLTNSNFNISDNILSNIGWRGIDVQYGYIGNIRNNSVTSTGSHGLGIDIGTDPALHASERVEITGNYVTRAVPPTMIYSALPEQGFLLGIGAGSKYCVVDGNICIDNRNALDDGIGIGESTTAKHSALTISNNIVRYSGGFGIDAVGSSVITNNVVQNAGTVGITIAADLGEDVELTHITGNVITNANERNVAGVAGILCNAQVAGSAMDFLNISNNTVFDGRTPKQTAYGIHLDPTNVTFGNSIQVNHNDVSEVLTKGVHPSSAALAGLRAIGNYGFVTDATGGLNVANGTNSAVVTHGLDQTPALTDIVLFATTADGSNRSFWITDVTATTFTVNISPTATTAAVYYGWQATVARTNE